MARNIYGLTKLPEVKPQSSSDRAKDVAGGAVAGAQTGAQMGSALGPKGAAIGAALGLVAGGASSFIAGRDRLTKDTALKNIASNYNQGVERLDTVGDVNSNVMTARYEMGGVSKSQHVGEMETNELHYDQNYNLKNDGLGAKPHEEGGVKIAVQEGDVVFDTQDPKERLKVKSLVKRYKLNGDQMAKKQLDNMKDALPKKGEGAMYEDGGVVRFDTDPYEYEFVDGTWKTRKKGSDNWTNLNQAGIDELSKRGVDINPTDGPLQSKEAPSTNTEFQQPFGEPTYNNTGTITPTTKEDYWPTQDKSRSHLRYDFDNFNDPTRDTNPSLKTGIGKYSGDVTDLKNVNLKTGPNKYDAGIDSKIETQPLGFEGTSGKTPFLTEERMNKLEGGIGTLASTMNIINNFKRGSEELQRPERRRYIPEEQRYRDMSDPLRQSALESRNAQMQQMRGRGLSAAQATGYGRAVARNYDRSMADIESRELARRDQFDQINTQQRNQAKQYNLQAADRYDAIERQQIANRDKYTDTAFAELSQMGDLAAQRGWMKERNRKQYEMDEKTLPLIGTADYKIEDNDDAFNVYYKNRYKIN